MRTSFVIISVSDRIHELNHLLGTIRADRRWDPIDIWIMFQDPGGVASQIKRDAMGERAGRVMILVEPELLGCHGARVHLLRRMPKYDAYINLDDDMEVGPETNYWPAVRKALHPEVGFVITNWARTRPLLEKKLPAKEEFAKQIMIYNGGGMAYAEKIAALMRELEPVKTAFDCAWPITSYVNGYTNLYYYGSLTVHRVCVKGGMNTFMKATPLHVMCQEWLRFKPLARQNGSCMDVAIPLDADVLPAAKELHKKNRLARFGTDKPYKP